MKISLRDYRKNYLKKTQIEIAQLLGITHQAYSRIEKGGNKPQGETVLNLAGAIGKTVGYDFANKVIQVEVNASDLPEIDPNNPALGEDMTNLHDLQKRYNCLLELITVLRNDLHKYVQSSQSKEILTTAESIEEARKILDKNKKFF